MEPTDANLRAWNASRAGGDGLAIAERIRALLPDLTGRHVLQLVCGTGEAAGELAALGALVTGVDLSEDALEVARRRTPNAVFLRAQLEALPAELLRARFDLVYGDGGLLAEVRELDPLFSQISTSLRPGGELLLHDTHPVAVCLDPASLRWRGDYFAGPWQLGELVNGLAGTGLGVRRLEEFRDEERPRQYDPRVPAEFALVATKPVSE